MKHSRQIIYPINYFLIFKDFFKKNKNSVKEILLKKITKILHYKNNCFFVGRARSGIYLLVKFFLEFNRPKVAMSPFTIPDVVNMVICAGGIPVFVDFEKKTTFLNVNQLEFFFKKNDCSILILTHYNINEKNYLVIKNLCTKYNVKLIEDCAISMGGKSNEVVNIGSLCDGAVYSFSSFKFLNFFWGGLVYLKDDMDFDKIKYITKSWKFLSFKDYLPSVISCIKFDIFTSNYIFNYFTFNVLQTTLNKNQNLVNKQYADFEVGKLDHTYFTLPSEVFYNELFRKIDNFYFFQEKRLKNSLIYYNLLSKFSIPYNISEELIINSSCYNYLIYSENKKNLRVKLAKLGFDTGFSMYQNSHKFPRFSKFEGYSNEVDNLIDNSIVLPTHYLITENYARQLSQAVLSNYY
jgi:dTDP-4-amino-4,6-dideoxygalactose transaminase